jgi:hypothetical protein
MNNMAIYDATRKVPQEAQKSIGGGRLKGMTDINPMWRLETLTRQFGPCGVGWKYTIEKQWIDDGHDGERSAFVNINLYIKVDGSWSDAIPGTGGSSFVAKEKSGLYTSDECYKMALTDAISVACKALGFGADVYWQNGTKIRQDEDKPGLINDEQITVLRDLLGMGKAYTESVFCKEAKVQKLEQLPAIRYDGAFKHVQAQIAKEMEWGVA